MERESNPMQPQCRSGCGFYGNPAQDGLCSVCYKDSLRKKQQPPVSSTPVSVPSPQNTPTFSPAITITNTAKPTVQSLHQHNDLIKEVMSEDRLFKRKIAAAPERPIIIVDKFEPKDCEPDSEILAVQNSTNNLQDQNKSENIDNNKEENHNKKNENTKNNLGENNNNGTTKPTTTTSCNTNPNVDASVQQTNTDKNLPPSTDNNIPSTDNNLPCSSREPTNSPQNSKFSNKSKIMSIGSAKRKLKKLTTLVSTIHKKDNNEKKVKLNEDGVNKDNLVSAAGPSTSTNNEQDEDKDDGDKDGKKKKNRCATCRKKVGLTGFECRCGGLYCAVHRYSDKHNCTFDYREHGAQEIRRNNPVVVGEKIQKI